MPLIMVTSLYPPSKRFEVGKKSLESLKKFPADETIAKNLALGIMRSELGIKLVTISEVMEGKLVEALNRTHEVIDFFTEIEGFNARIDLLATGPEAMASIDMKIPE